MTLTVMILSKNDGNEWFLYISISIIFLFSFPGQIFLKIRIFEKLPQHLSKLTNIGKKIEKKSLIFW